MSKHPPELVEKIRQKFYGVHGYKVHDAEIATILDAAAEWAGRRTTTADGPYTAREYTPGGKWLVHGPTLPELGALWDNQRQAVIMRDELNAAYAAGAASRASLDPSKYPNIRAYLKNQMPLYADVCRELRTLLGVE